MKIYSTPFRHSDKQTTGPSVDSGFQSMGHVIDALGPDTSFDNGRMVIYGKNDDRVCFSYFPFNRKELPL